MDAAEILERQRELAAQIIEMGDAGPGDWADVSHRDLEGLAYLATMLAEGVQELDQLREQHPDRCWCGWRHVAGQPHRCPPGHTPEP